MHAAARVPQPAPAAAQNLIRLVANSVLETAGIAAEGYMVATAAAMEAPAIISGLFLSKQGSEDAEEASGNLPMREVFLSGSVVLLLGSFVIGWMTGQRGMTELAPIVDAPFKGALCLFLLDMGIVAGLAMYGHKVMATIGTRITLLTPSHGFAATLAAAVTVVLASGTGLPISTTHTLVGAVLGVGMARGIGAIDLRVVRSIVVSWLVTLPAGAGLAIVFFFALMAIFD